MTQEKEAPWIFVLKEEMLPGRFSLQPIEPSVAKLRKIDPQHTIMKSAYLAYTWASAEYETYARLVEHDIDVFARMLSRCLEKQLKIRKAFVIPHEEFKKRVYRGEFEELGVFSLEEQLAMGEAFHLVMSSAIKDYYSGLPRERQEEMMLRMRSFDLSDFPRNSTYIGYDEERGGLSVRPLYSPEVYQIRKTQPPRKKRPRWLLLQKRAERHLRRQSLP